MRYTIRVTKTTDNLESPWPLVVEDTKHPEVLTVQEPHPLAGDNLIGFEQDHEDVKVYTVEEDWPERAIGLHPVFATKGGMYSVRILRVESVEKEQD